MAIEFETIEEMKEAIENGEINKNKVADRILQIEAAEAFADEFEKIVSGVALSKKLRTFLESEDFAETIYSIILNAGTSKVDSDKHLTIKELKHLKNHSAKTEELLAICRKFRKTMQNILLSQPERLSELQLKDKLDYNIIIFQGLFVYYTDNLNHKLETHHQ